MSNTDSDATRPLGVVVGGSLTKGLEVRLDPDQSAQLGQYAMADVGGGLSLLGMVTDITLKSVDSGPTVWPPGDDEPSLLREVLQDTGVYTALAVDPYLELGENGEEPARARRLPNHFAAVLPADQNTLDRAFATDGPAIPVGAPLGMDELEVGVDFERLFERSAGVFGKSGTGKSVLVLHLLDAMLTRSAAASTNSDRTVALVFDMHNDYGWEMKFQGPTTSRLRSLKQRHQTEAELYTLESRVARSDGQILIGTRDIEPDDLEVLRETLDLTDLAIDAAHACRRRFGPGWIDEILADEPSAGLVNGLWREPPEGDVNWSQVAAQMGYPGSLESLRRRMERLTRREFVRTDGAQFGDVIKHIVSSLQGGKSVIVQFGRFGNDLTSYMLVANMLSRRIWERYRDSTERSREQEAPNRLVIVIEEAHKFVDRSLAGQSIFGQIARELRKYNVTLLVIDQRPSQIDPEVLSQIGTKFTLQLDSDNDVEAIVGGVQGRSGLRQVIASLESKRQALVFGHALPMPVVVQTPEATNDDSARASLRARLGLPEHEETSPAAALFGAPERDHEPPGDPS
ncbi:MAG: ATP-binding protein [Dehalococcoidia bacterium]|nr:ATP-binding protein [Dehalococcoidia bacterium]MYA52712.1 ATP-binding protein [Dehalococcoidia bacterium]